jgi:hypothetical protein
MEGMRRGWVAIAILFFLTGLVAQEARFAGHADRVKFRRPLPRLYPYTVATGDFAEMLRQAGLAVFSSLPPRRYYLPASPRQADFTRVVGGGVRMDAAARLAVFLEFRYFSGLVRLARATLPHSQMPRLGTRPMALQAGFRFLLSEFRR